MNTRILWPVHQNKEDSKEWYLQRVIVPCAGSSFATEKEVALSSSQGESTEPV